MTAASDAIKSNVLPKVSVIIVTYNSTQELPGCIESVLRQTPHMEVFLVDNASPDSTPEMVTDYGARFDNIFPILNTENIGLAAGNNCPIGKCKGDYVLILNPDTVLRDDTLERMVNLLDENPDIGVLGPKSLYEDGTAHVSFFHHWGFLQIWFWRILPYQMSRVCVTGLLPIIVRMFCSYQEPVCLFAAPYSSKLAVMTRSTS